MEVRPKGPECALTLRSEVGRSGPRSEEERLYHLFYAQEQRVASF